MEHETQVQLHVSPRGRIIQLKQEKECRKNPQIECAAVRGSFYTTFTLWLVGLHKNAPPELSFGAQFEGLSRSLTFSLSLSLKLLSHSPVGPVKGESSSTGSLLFGPRQRTADTDKSGPAEAWNAVQISLTPQCNHTLSISERWKQFREENENTVIIYSPSCHSRSVLLCVFGWSAKREKAAECLAFSLIIRRPIKN